MLSKATTLLIGNNLLRHSFSFLFSMFSKKNNYFLFLLPSLWKFRLKDKQKEIKYFFSTASLLVIEMLSVVLYLPTLKPWHMNCIFTYLYNNFRYVWKVLNFFDKMLIFPSLLISICFIYLCLIFISFIYLWFEQSCPKPYTRSWYKNALHTACLIKVACIINTALMTPCSSYIRAHKVLGPKFLSLKPKA